MFGISFRFAAKVGKAWPQASRNEKQEFARGFYAIYAKSPGKALKILRKLFAQSSDIGAEILSRVVYMGTSKVDLMIRLGETPQGILDLTAAIRKVCQDHVIGTGANLIEEIALENLELARDIIIETIKLDDRYGKIAYGPYNSAIYLAPALITNIYKCNAAVGDALLGSLAQYDQQAALRLISRFDGSGNLKVSGKIIAEVCRHQNPNEMLLKTIPAIARQNLELAESVMCELSFGPGGEFLMRKHEWLQAEEALMRAREGDEAVDRKNDFIHKALDAQTRAERNWALTALVDEYPGLRRGEPRPKQSASPDLSFPPQLKLVPPDEPEPPKLFHPRHLRLVRLDEDDN